MPMDDRPAPGAGGDGSAPPTEPEPETSRAECPSADEKRAALEHVLQSTHFERADQLRHFLRYVCEMELAGRGPELNEHLIGVEALGRPPGYSTADDSGVRRCAHALRQKLEEAYATELTGARVQIELPRGTYQPRFRFAAGPSVAPGAASTNAARPRSVGAYWVLVAFALGAALGAAAPWIWPPHAARRLDPIVAEAWGPLVRPGAKPLICMSSPPHYGILPYPEGPLPPKVEPLPEPLNLMSWWKEHYPPQPGYRLAGHLTTGPIRLGEVLGLVSALRLLDRRGLEPEVVAEKNVALPALLGRNLLLFGNPEYSHATAKLLERAPLTVAYDTSHADRVVRSTGQADPKLFTPTRNQRGALTDVLGLITVLPSEGAPEGSTLRTIVISCTNAAGCQAALEFLTSPGSLRGLLDRLRKDGLTTFPEAYQTVIRSQVFQTSQAISGDYEAHVVFQP